MKNDGSDAYYRKLAQNRKYYHTKLKYDQKRIEYTKNFHKTYHPKWVAEQKEKRMRILSVEVDDGKNNMWETHWAFKITENMENNRIKWTTEFIDEMCDDWVDWLREAYVVNENGDLLFRMEVTRTTYNQFCNYYYHAKNVSITKTKINQQRLKNDYLAERLNEIDQIYEDLMVEYSAAGRINSSSSKFLLSNIHKENFQDVKINKNHNLIESFIVHEQTFELPQSNTTSTKALYSGDEDFFDFEEEE